MRSAEGVHPSNRKQALTSMKVARLGIVTLSFVVALALALVIGALGTVLGGAGTPPATQAGEPSAAPGRQQTYEGMVTESPRRARHQSASGKTATDCTRACVHAGSQFALVDGDKTYLLEGDPLALKRAAGMRS